MDISVFVGKSFGGGGGGTSEEAINGQMTLDIPLILWPM